MEAYVFILCGEPSMHLVSRKFDCAEILAEEWHFIEWQPSIIMLTSFCFWMAPFSFRCFIIEASLWLSLCAGKRRGLSVNI